MGSFFQQVNVMTQRTYSDQQAPYLVTIVTDLPGGTDANGHYISGCIQCRCVVDDFGNLVPVRGWH